MQRLIVAPTIEMGCAGPGRTCLAAFVASSRANFTDWEEIGRLSEGSAGYSSLLRDDDHQSYLVLWEDFAMKGPSPACKPGMGLWLSRFSLE
jgi:hypothetical protein